MATSDEQHAADLVEAEREDELDELEYLMGLFALEFMSRLEETGELGAIQDVWEKLTFEAWGQPFAEEATRQALAVMSTVGLDFAAVTQLEVDGIAAEHVAGFADYGRFLASVVHYELTRPKPPPPLVLTAAGRLPEPVVSALDKASAIREALSPHLAKERLAKLAENIKAHLRNAATSLILGSKRNARRRAQDAEAGGVDYAGAPGKVWLTLRDGRVRSAHARAHGQRSDDSGYFHIDGHPARYPGDTSLPVELWINCRCFIAPDGWDPDDYVRRVAEARNAVVCPGQLQLPIQAAGSDTPTGAVCHLNGATVGGREMPMRFTGDEDAFAWGAREYGEFTAGLSADDWRAIHDYVGGRSQYRRINRHMRGVEDLADTDLPPDTVSELLESITRLRGLLDRSTVPNDLTAFRAFDNRGLPPEFRAALADGSAVGTTFHDDAFMSTSLNPQYVKDAGDWEMELTVPAGTKGMYMGVDERGEMYEWGEAELLLQAGQTMRIDAIEGNVIKATVVT